MSRPYVLSETTWALVKSTKYDVAILPWGATEAHNYHLPYGTDNYQCDFVAHESARIAWERGAKTIVFPTIPFGVNTGQLDIKLDLNLFPSTQLAIIRDIAQCVSMARIEKLVILNGHGGNDFRQIIREIQSNYSEMLICNVNWYQLPSVSQHFGEGGHVLHTEHAGELETSVMLHIQRNLVRPLSEAGSGYAREFSVKALNEGWAWAERRWTRVTEDTGIGNPEQATAEKGRNCMRALTLELSDFFVELAACSLDQLYV